MEIEKKRPSQKPIREKVENSLKLDLRRMFSSGALYAHCDTHGTWRCTASSTGRCIDSVSYHAIIGEQSGTLTLLHPHVDTSGRHCMLTYDIRLSSIPLHYGGRRWYMHCPLTGRRAQILRKWQGTAKFCHRAAFAIAPTYASQRTSENKRIIAKRIAIREKLGSANPSLFVMPRKPRRMRWLTYSKYIHRELALARSYHDYIMRLMGQDRKLR
jgi:hypothetical protein